MAESIIKPPLTWGLQVRIQTSGRDALSNATTLKSFMEVIRKIDRGWAHPTEH